jgi:hypothetical protein
LTMTTTTSVTTTTKSTTTACLPTCYGQSCDEWFLDNQSLTCDFLTDAYGCDCSGCSCGSCPRTCFGYTCEFWAAQNDEWTCDFMASEYGCDCSGCNCPVQYLNRESTYVTTTATSTTTVLVERIARSNYECKWAYDQVPQDCNVATTASMLASGMCDETSLCYKTLEIYQTNCRTPYPGTKDQCTACSFAFRALEDADGCVDEHGPNMDMVCSSECEDLYRDVETSCEGTMPPDEDPEIFAQELSRISRQLLTCFQPQCIEVPESWARLKGAAACRVSRRMANMRRAKGI